ncbi:MAG TPA: GNAT family protein [Mycobacteriales bacterium]|nr:GNAT family protein [Mycobacteriales bacterium]
MIELRPVRLTDWPVVHEWGGDPEVSRFQAWGPNSEQETQEFVAGAVAAAAESPQRRFSFVAEKSGRVCGGGEFNLRSGTSGEISYVVHPRNWRQGVGTAIARELLRYGFGLPGIHRIYGTCDPRNVGSGKILRGIGMSYEGRMRQVALIRDGWRDSDLYSILRPEWDATRRADFR